MSSYRFHGGPLDGQDRDARLGDRPQPPSTCYRAGGGLWHFYRASDGGYTYGGECITIPDLEHGPAHTDVCCCGEVHDGGEYLRLVAMRDELARNLGRDQSVDQV